MTDLIPDEQLEAVRRNTARKFASGIVAAMGETDTSFEVIDKRLGWDARGAKAKAYVDRLISGDSAVTLDRISDMLWAMGCEMDLHIKRSVDQDVELGKD